MEIVYDAGSISSEKIKYSLNKNLNMNIHVTYNNKDRDNLNAFQFRNAKCGLFIQYNIIQHKKMNN